MHKYFQLVFVNTLHRHWISHASINLKKFTSLFFFGGGGGGVYNDICIHECMFKVTYYTVPNSCEVI